MNDVTTRPCGPDESPQWKEFLDLTFGYRSPHSYAEDFAPLFATSALERSRLIWKDGKIVSSATLYPVTVINPWVRMNLAIIGAVATAEEFRGQGFSSKILGELEEQARAGGKDGIILWSDQVQFYEKAGYAPVGQQLIYPLNGLPAPEKITPGMPAYGWDWQKVRSLYECHPLRVDRSDEYWNELQKINSCTRVQWLSESGEVLAYLGFDRGRDLHGIVHEWGGDPNALYSLLWTVLQNRQNLLWFTHPRLDDPIAHRLQNVEPISGSLGLFKPLSDKVTATNLAYAWFWGLDSL